MVKVTDADREAAASVAVLPGMRELILAGRADHHAEPFARHRIAGAKAALEKAAKIKPTSTPADECETVGQWTRRTMREAIRNIDPESVGE